MGVGNGAPGRYTAFRVPGTSAPRSRGWRPQSFAGFLSRGYEVCAFEPVAPLFESARNHRARRQCEWWSRKLPIRTSWRELRASQGRWTALRGRVDLCILGWGSLSHLTEPNAVLETLRAVRALAPDAPVITSFLLRLKGTPDVKRRGARNLRLGAQTRLFEAAGGPPVPAGLNPVATLHGSFHEFSRSELVDLCAQAGYEVRTLRRNPRTLTRCSCQSLRRARAEVPRSITWPLLGSQSLR